MAKLTDPNMNSTTNLSLLLKLRSKTEAAAWSHFVKLYAPLIHRWVGAIGIHEPDRSDVAQDVFMVLLGKMSTFQYDPQKSFRGWLRTITLNKCRDLLRVRRSKTEAVVLERIERAARDDSELMTEAEYRDHLANSALKLMREHFFGNNLASLLGTCSRRTPRKRDRNRTWHLRKRGLSSQSSRLETPPCRT